MKNWTKLFFKAALSLMIAVPVFTSCYSDDALWDKIGDLEEKIDSLANNLNDQASALNSLMKDGTKIASCTKNSDGSYTIELSNGTKFTVMPEGTDFSSLVSCKLVDGKYCWATYDANGNLVPLTDNSGNPIPVNMSISVKVVDGAYCLVVNGKEYVTGYDAEEVVQVFSSCTPLTDASGQVYAVKFTLGEGWEVTVAVDGYRGVLFKQSSLNTKILTDYFIDYGQSQTLLMDTQGVIDYVMQIPDGWRVSEKIDELTGELYVTITAPTEETVALGAAVAGGDLKVVSVVEGGKAAVTRLSLSTDPFKTYNVTALKAVIDVYSGVQKYLYGISQLADFNKEQILEKVSAYLTSGADLPTGGHESDQAINLSHEDIYPDLTEDGSYVFWAVPALFREADGETEGGFYVREDMFRSQSLSPVSVKLEVSDVTLLDANLKLSVVGTTKFYGAVVPKTDKVLEDIVSQVNIGVYEPLTDNSLFKYEGPVSEFPDSEFPMAFEPATTYVVWAIPVEAGKTEFTIADVVYTEFSTKEVQPGGSLEVTVGEAEVTKSSIAQKVTCEDAAMIYYAYLDNTTGTRYSKDNISNETKWKYLTQAATFQTVRGSSVDAVIDELMPQTTMWLFAAAVGNDGLYGNVKCVSAATQSVTFNSLSVALTVTDITSSEATVNVAVTGGDPTGYIYWIGRKSDEFWVSTCGSDKDKAGKFMAANPDADAVVKVMKKYGDIDENGLLKLNDLMIAKEYVVLVLAQDASGNYSKVGYKSFTTEAISLGPDYAPEGSNKWNTAKTWIEDNIVWNESSFKAAAGQGQGFASYSFDIKIPEGLTAYISCFATAAAYNGGGLVDIMVELEQECSSKTSVGKYVVDSETGEEPRHPDWYDDKGRLIQGSQVNVYEMYAHGNPNEGMVTYFAADAHDDTHCISWNGTSCTNYDEQMASISKLTSLDYWREYIVDFGNYAYMGDPDHQYSRTLKDPEKIEQIATRYWELYCKYYAGMTPHIYINNGEALHVTNRQAGGLDEEGNVLDVVTVMLKDVNGNYYDPMYFPVPNYFK